MMWTRVESELTHLVLGVAVDRIQEASIRGKY